MGTIKWPYFDPEYDTMNQRMNPPGVIVDNSNDDVTLIKVHSTNKHGILLEVVQVLTDLDLTISKAYISSDGGWFMDVFHVTDQLGNKVTDDKLISYIQESLGAKQSKNPTLEVRTCMGRRVRLQTIAEHTVIELTGPDRPGLLSEISAVLSNLKCNVVTAEVWTHNSRVACVIYITNEANGGPVEESSKLAAIQEQLRNILKAQAAVGVGEEEAEANDRSRGVRTDFSMGLTHMERRLHQLMFANRDYESTGPYTSHYTTPNSNLAHNGLHPTISIENCAEKGYSVINVRCKDRPKLLFDTVCTLTDMQYVIFHASVNSNGPYANQEYYIRHMDGCILDTEGERKRVQKCLEAAIERRISQGTRLELRTSDRVGLLSDITRLLRENGLSVTRAGVSTQGGDAVDVFYVTNADGGPVDRRNVETMKSQISQTYLSTSLKVRDTGASSSSSSSSSSSTFFFSSSSSSSSISSDAECHTQNLDAFYDVQHRSSWSDLVKLLLDRLLRNS